MCHIICCHLWNLSKHCFHAVRLCAYYTAVFLPRYVKYDNWLRYLIFYIDIQISHDIWYCVSFYQMVYYGVLHPHVLAVFITHLIQLSINVHAIVYVMPGDFMSNFGMWLWICTCKAKVNGGGQRLGSDSGSNIAFIHILFTPCHSDHPFLRYGLTPRGGQKTMYLIMK